MGLAFAFRPRVEPDHDIIINESLALTIPCSRVDPTVPGCNRPGRSPQSQAVREEHTLLYPRPLYRFRGRIPDLYSSPWSVMESTGDRQLEGLQDADQPLISAVYLAWSWARLEYNKALVQISCVILYLGVYNYCVIVDSLLSGLVPVRRLTDGLGHHT